MLATLTDREQAFPRFNESIESTEVPNRSVRRFQVIGARAVQVHSTEQTEWPNSNLLAPNSTLL